MPTPQELKEFASDHLGYSEVDGFCADYFREVYDEHHGIGLTRSAYIRELIFYCERRDKLNDLAAALQKELPDLYAKKFPPAPVTDAPARAHDARRVFVSHSTKDAEFAHRLADDLRKNGFDAWIAPESILPGEKWVEAIERGLTESGIFLAVLTPNAVKSKWVKSETQLAIQREHNDQIRIITLVREVCDVGALSQFLTTYQSINFVNGYPLNSLLAALRGTPAQPAPSPSQKEGGSRAQVPPSAGGGDGGGGNAKLLPKIAPALVLPTPSPSHGEGGSQSPKTIWIHDPLEMQFMRVDAGEFLMGSDKTKDPDAYDWELPQHKVFLDEYYMGKYPVTNVQYAVYAKAKGIKFSIPSGKDQHPVVNVRWSDANSFCEWLNKAQSKYKIALPTEAQWEKAARGINGQIYPWGDQKPDKTLCNFGGNEGGTTPVGKYSPQGDSPYECADMAGNVWEWCADYWTANAYAMRRDRVTRNPTGPDTGEYRVLRGGSYFVDGRNVRCAFRLRDYYVLFYNNLGVGFRVVVRSH